MITVTVSGATSGRLSARDDDPRGERVAAGGRLAAPSGGTPAGGRAAQVGPEALAADGAEHAWPRGGDEAAEVDQLAGLVGLHGGEALVGPGRARRSESWPCTRGVTVLDAGGGREGPAAAEALGWACGRATGLPAGLLGVRTPKYSRCTYTARRFR